MKVAFAGTPEFARQALEALVAAGHEVVLVLTQPDRPAGRGMKLQASPVKQLAAALEPVERYISSNGCPPVKFSTHPHMAIARRLNPGTYEQAMFTFSQRSFYAAFTVQELVLLKRRTSFDAARQVSVFRLL